MTCSAASRSGAAGALAQFSHRTRDRRPRLVGLGHEHHPFRTQEAGAEFFAHEVQNRVPRRILLPDQAVGRPGAVADEVGAGEFGDFLRSRGHFPGHAVNRGIGEAGDRHVGRVDPFALPAPFFGQGFGQRAVGNDQRRPGGRAHRLAVKPYAEAVVLGCDAHLGIKLFRQRALQVALRGLQGIALAGLDENRAQIVTHCLNSSKTSRSAEKSETICAAPAFFSLSWR